MVRQKGFNVIVSSDFNYKKLCAEIYFNGEFIAIITQEEGIENACIEIANTASQKKWTFKYSDFIKILNQAYDELK